jgi:hypothetical protein
MSVTDLHPVMLAAFNERTTMPPLTRIIQHGRTVDSARFTLEFEDAPPLTVRNSEVLFSRVQMTKLIAVERHCGVLAIKQPEWMDMIVGLLGHATEIEEDPDEKLASSVEDWIAQYADSNATRDREGAARRRSPFIDPRTHRLHINIDHFARWVKTMLVQQISTVELRLALIDLGWERAVVQYDAGSGSGQSATRKRTKTRYWREPHDSSEPEPLNGGTRQQLALRPRGVAPTTDEVSRSKERRAETREPLDDDWLASDGSGGSA